MLGTEGRLAGMRLKRIAVLAHGLGLDLWAAGLRPVAAPLTEITKAQLRSVGFDAAGVVGISDSEVGRGVVALRPCWLGAQAALMMKGMSWPTALARRRSIATEGTWPAFSI